MSIKETDPFPTEITQIEWDHCLKRLSEEKVLKEILIDIKLGPEQVTSDIDKVRMAVFIKMYEIIVTLNSHLKMTVKP